MENYRGLLKNFTKLDLNRKFKSLTAKEFQIVIDAIQRIEGWKPGTEELIPSSLITSVQRNKRGIIVEYQVQGKGWLSKAQLIALIETEGGVDAVVVYPSGRRPFIRMRPDSTRLNNLNLS